MSIFKNNKYKQLKKDYLKLKEQSFATEQRNLEKQDYLLRRNQFLEKENEKLYKQLEENKEKNTKLLKENIDLLEKIKKLLKGGVDINTLAEIWGRGYTTAKPLQFNEHGIVGIAKYLVKDPILGKRWCASRNLKQPKESQRDGRISQRKVRDFHDSGADNREEIERLFDGYALSDVEPIYNSFNGGYYLTVRMYRKTDHKKVRKRGNTTKKIT